MNHMNKNTWFSDSNKLKINESESYCGLIKVGYFDSYIGRINCPDCLKLYYSKYPNERR